MHFTLVRCHRRGQPSLLFFLSWREISDIKGQYIQQYKAFMNFIHHEKISNLLLFPSSWDNSEVVSRTFTTHSSIADIHVLQGAQMKGWLLGTQPARRARHHAGASTSSPLFPMDLGGRNEVSTVWRSASHKGEVIRKFFQVSWFL